MAAIMNQRATATLTAEKATQAIDALMEYRELLIRVDELRETLARKELELVQAETFIASLGLFGVTVAPVTISIPDTVFVPAPAACPPPDGMQTCAGWNGNGCKNAVGPHSKTGRCKSCAMKRVKAEQSPEAARDAMAKARAAKIAATPSLVLPEHAPVTVGVEQLDVAQLPMPPTNIEAIMSHPSHRNMLMSARSVAVRTPAVIANGVCNLSWEWYEDKIRGMWEIAVNAWEADGAGLIELLRRDGDNFISSATGGIVGRIQAK